MLPSKPLLAFTVKDLSAVKFPVMASPKLDGIRALIGTHGPVSRSLKPIPNHWIRGLLTDPALMGLDGEIMLRDPKATFRQVTSAVMSEDGRPDFIFWAFDHVVNPFSPFSARFALAERTTEGYDKAHVDSVYHHHIYDLATLTAYEEECVAQGYEGIMVRDRNGVYKPGRSTTKEGILGKVKRYSDAEALVIGVEELLHNNNTPTTNALGHTERSSHQSS
jgi:DNA ligase-1